MIRPLAKGWAEIELGDHVYIAGRIGWRGLKAEEYKPAGPILLSVPNLNHGDEVDFGKVHHITQARFAESPEIQLKVGDTLLVKDGAGIGKLGFVANLPGPTTVNSSLLVVRPANEFLENKYLFYYLKGPKFQQIALERISGSATPHLFQKDIKKLQLLAPPLAEQRRIVAKLEMLLGKVDASQQRLAKIPVLLKRFRQSVLAAACSGRLTADWREQHDQHDEWPVHKLSALGRVTGGITKNAKRQSIRLQVPYLRVANVYQDRLELDDVLRIGITQPELERTRLAKGDLLFVEGNGSLDQIGRLAMWDGSIPECVHQNHLIKFRAGNLVEPRYVLLQMMAQDGRSQLVEKAISSAGLHSLSISKISDVSLPVAPLPEQQEIVRRVEGLFALADQLEERLAKARGQVDALTPSLLARAFAGKLVPQSPNDEPAEKLLERIRKKLTSEQNRIPT